jgi:hypothetical protein
MNISCSPFNPHISLTDWGIVFITGPARPFQTARRFELRLKKLAGILPNNKLLNYPDSAYAYFLVNRLFSTLKQISFILGQLIFLTWDI